MNKARQKTTVILLSLTFIILFSFFQSMETIKQKKHQKDLHYCYNIEENLTTRTEIGAPENFTSSIFRKNILLDYIPYSSNDNSIVKFKFLTIGNEYFDKLNPQNQKDKIAPQLQKAVELFKGLEFQFSTTNNKIQNVDGLKEFRSKLINLNHHQTDSSLSFFNENYFRETFEKFVCILPPQEFSAGFEWNIENTREIGKFGKLTSAYKCVDIRDNIIYIESKATLQNELLVTNHLIKVKGVETGKIEFDQKSRMLIRSVKELKSEGVTLIGGISYKIKTTGITNVIQTN
jgi:hypothetical protein